MTDPATLRDAARAIRAGSATSEALTARALALHDTHIALNAIAFIEPDRALDEARRLDALARERKWLGPLHGVPVTIKDLFNVRDMPTRCGAKATMPAIEPREATAVQRLREAGALILAKANMVEIALGTTGENMWTGDVRNPHDPARMSGGSSSGSAVAVAVGIGFGSLGSDTAGSIRLPAAWCGVAGFKPTYGRVPLDGAMALCWSCDHAGPLAPTVSDCAMMFGALVGEPMEPTPRRPACVGVPCAYLDGALTAEVRELFERQLARIADEGVQIVDVAPEHIEHGVAAFVPLRAESSFVHRAAIENEPHNFSPFVRAELERGLRVTGVDYLEGLRLQKLVREGMTRCLRSVDAIVLPTVPLPAPARGTSDVVLESGPTTLRAALLRLARPLALAGAPTVTVPMGKVGGLPVGMQLACDVGRDRDVLSFGAWLEALVQAA